MRQVTNNESLEFKDLTSEDFRTYYFSDGESVTLVEPVALHVSASGGHRVMTADGVAHYIPPRWIHLFWVNKPDLPAFQF